MLRLSKNFKLAELTKSQIALRNGIDNTPSTEQLQSLELLVGRVLQPVRDHFEKPVTVTSGFRCAHVNRLLGSIVTSQHTKGQAADIEIHGVDNYELACWIRDNLEFDQLILEFYTGVPNSGWVHVSYSSKNRQECLSTNKGTVSRGLIGRK